MPGQLPFLGSQHSLGHAQPCLGGLKQVSTKQPLRCKACTEAMALWTRTSSQVWACVKYVPKVLVRDWPSTLAMPWETTRADAVEKHRKIAKNVMWQRHELREKRTESARLQVDGAQNKGAQSQSELGNLWSRHGVRRDKATKLTTIHCFAMFCQFFTQLGASKAPLSLSKRSGLKLRIRGHNCPYYSSDHHSGYHCHLCNDDENDEE